MKSSKVSRFIELANDVHAVVVEEFCILIIFLIIYGSSKIKYKQNFVEFTKKKKKML